jgi:hypothetical protein
LKKSLLETKFEELKGKSFELVHIVEMLCEICEKPITAKEKVLRKIEILSKDELEILLNKGSVHDRAEVDVENGKIWFYDHDFPGDVHPECLERM